MTTVCVKVYLIVKLKVHKLFHTGPNSGNLVGPLSHHWNKYVLINSLYDGFDLHGPILPYRRLRLLTRGINQHVFVKLWHQLTGRIANGIMKILNISA